MPQDDCPVCLDEVTHRRFLPCGHSLCNGCFERLTQNSSIVCPLDRRRFSLPGDGIQPRESFALPNVPEATVIQRPPVPDLSIFTIQQTNGTNRPPDSMSVSSDQDNFFNKIRSRLRDGIGKRLDDDYNDHGKIATATLLLVTVARFIAGAVKLQSECDREYHVAVFLFVKSWFGALLFGVMLYLLFRKLVESSLKNLFYEIYLAFDSLFGMIWLIIGSTWTLHDVKDLKDGCRSNDGDWNEHFINFAIFLTVTDWMFVTLFLFGFAYILCDNSVQSE